MNAVMRGPDWSSTAIFLAWDDWGGFYDHVRAAVRRRQRLRLPGAGHRDQPVRAARVRRPPDAVASTPTSSSSRTTSWAAQRLDPSTDGRPDPRPDVRENDADARQPGPDFDFTQPPRPPRLLPEHPHTTLTG